MIRSDVLFLSRLVNIAAALKLAAEQHPLESRDIDELFVKVEGAIKACMACTSMDVPANVTKILEFDAGKGKASTIVQQVTPLVRSLIYQSLLVLSIIYRPLLPSPPSVLSLIFLGYQSSHTNTNINTPPLLYHLATGIGICEWPFGTLHQAPSDRSARHRTDLYPRTQCFQCIPAAHTTHCHPGIT